jgi:cytochrome subunit of sulfide dehydrogenase
METRKQPTGLSPWFTRLQSNLYGKFILIRAIFEPLLIYLTKLMPNYLKFFTPLFFLLFAGVMAASAQAQPISPDPLQVRSWAASCSNCHGTNGQAQPGMASLAGQSKEDIIGKMREFKSGQRPATVMHQLAKGYSDSQIETIAAYFSAQKK